MYDYSLNSDIMTNPSRKIKIGILGCGPIAQFAYLEACQKAEHIDLYAVCDQAEELARKMGTFYGAEKIFTDYAEMLADEALEAINFEGPLILHGLPEEEVGEAVIHLRSLMKA